MPGGSWTCGVVVIRTSGKELDDTQGVLKRLPL